MAQTSDNHIRQRAYELWESEGRPEGRHDEHWHRARAEIERQYQANTEHVGEDPDRLKYPNAIEEAIDDPGRSQRPGGGKWASTSNERGAP